MTAEVERKRRELFEAHYPDINLERNKYRPEFYTALPTRMIWEAWNAALDAVEIELPPYTDEVRQYGHSHQSVIDAITATGLGLRIK